jgi:Asp/Glu/hydantoin racemase
MNDPKIALIHATPLAMKPVSEVFAALWPNAKCRNLLDDSLSPDLQEQGLTSAMVDRMVGLASYVKSQGAEAILFTCSAFGPAIDAAKRAHNIPILKPNEAMFDEALDFCERQGKPCRIGLLTTFAPASVSMQAEFQEAIEQRRLTAVVECACATGALEKLNAGDPQTHDRLLLETAAAMPSCDVYVLGQFSMARSQALLEKAVQKPVLTSPASAVRRLQSALGIIPATPINPINPTP